jgi:thiol:disulfide interchange protein DsbD
MRNWFAQCGRLRAGICLVAAICFFAPSVQAQDFLAPEQAFAFSARMRDAATIEVSFRIADGYYMYRDKIAVSAEGATLGKVEIPRGTIKFDPNFDKELETLRQQLTIAIPVQANGPFQLKVTSQGCADKGLCYPPMESVATLSTANSAVDVAAPAADGEMGRIEASLASGRLLLILPLFLLLGLGLSFTPCVLPMVPILSFIIAGEGAQTSRQRGLLLAVAYSLGMALVYTALGIAAGLIGEGLSATLQSPPILSAFAILMAVMALSMFDVYQLQIPASLQLALTRLSERQRGGKLLGVFVMGAISALIVGPCVAAPLAGALVYISQTRNVLIGGSALFAMAVGMSVPLLLVGISAGSLLPRAAAVPACAQAVQNLPRRPTPPWAPVAVQRTQLAARLVVGAGDIPLALAVDRRLGHPWVDEADVTRVRTDGDAIRAIGKGISVYDAYDTGLFLIGPELVAVLDGLARPSLSDGVAALARRDMARAVDVGDAPWLDVDDARALILARTQWRAG